MTSPVNLLPGWPEKLATAVVPQPPPAATPTLPRAASHYAGEINHIADETAALAMSELAQQRPLTAIGFAIESSYPHDGVQIAGQSVAHDPRRIVPTGLALVLLEPQGADQRLYRFNVDLQMAGVLPAVATILRLPCVFVAHGAQLDLLCLLQLGLPVPRLLWDTRIAEKALHLGRDHRNYQSDAQRDGHERHGRLDAVVAEQAMYSLLHACQRHQVPYPAGRARMPLARRSAHEATAGSLVDDRRPAALPGALAAVRLYQPQMAACTTQGIVQHLTTVEMPWVETNARMIWRGVRVDRELCARTAAACDQHLAVLQPQLAAMGVPSIRSDEQLAAFFGRAGLQDLFRRNGRPCFDKNLLSDFHDRHPAIPLIRAARRVHDLLGEKILSGELVGVDGRVHPQHCQLGTQTGRQTCRFPNILGLGRLFRPLIVPEPGYGLGEADWSQIEVGITAAVYHDERLVELFNTDDVYSAIAKDFFRERLTAADRALPGQEFKHKFSMLRDQVKTCTLGILYGLTPHGLAQRLAIREPVAAALLEQFLEQFPALQQARAATISHSAVRGHATAVTGLRRYRAAGGVLSNWERNWLVNFPVQGSAAAVFKSVGNRLDRLYRRYDAWLLVPLHDAFVFEAPTDALQQVAELTERVMAETVQEYFPELKPQVQVNIAEPSRWNKEGHADAVERWLHDPLYSF